MSTIKFYGKIHKKKAVIMYICYNLLVKACEILFRKFALKMSYPIT